MLSSLKRFLLFPMSLLVSIELWAEEAPCVGSGARFDLTSGADDVEL